MRKSALLAVYTDCKVLHTGLGGLTMYAAESRSDIVSATLSCVTWNVVVSFSLYD